MIKLYKKLEDGTINYWENWFPNDDTAYIHWGVIGDVGLKKEIRGSKATTEVKKEMTQKVSEGYLPIKDEDINRLIVEYKIEDMGDSIDLEKRQKLESLLEDLLGWTGLGDCDGGSMGSGSMEVCCFVVDYEVAKKVVEEKLKSTEFSDYTRIYLEE